MLGAIAAIPLAAAARVLVLKLVAPAMRRATRASRPAVTAVLALAVLSAACHEELGIRTGPAKERVEVAELELEMSSPISPSG